MEAKWRELYQPKLNYDENLKILRQNFEIMWKNDVPSADGVVEDEYELLSVIGQGSFGTVVASKSKKTGHIIAVKILLKEKLVKKNQVSHVISERKILHCICFPFLIYLEFSLKNDCYLYLGLPFITGGELFTYHRSMKHFTENEAKFYAAQVFLALEYLHNSNVIYRDLKPENIIIEHNGYIKLTDLGFAKKVESRTYTFCGTPEYFAPELIYLQPYGKSVDWWTFGVLIFEFVAGYSPFCKMTINELNLFEKICTAKYSIPHIFSADLKHLISNLLEVNISKRYGCMKNGPKDIKAHKWFKHINWTAILNKEIDSFYLPRIKKLSEFSNFSHNSNSTDDKYHEEFLDF